MLKEIENWNLELGKHIYPFIHLFIRSFVQCFSRRVKVSLEEKYETKTNMKKRTVSNERNTIFGFA